MLGNAKTQAARDSKRGRKSPRAPSRDNSVDVTSSHPSQIPISGKDRTSSQKSNRGLLAGRYVVRLQENGKIESVQRIRGRISPELLLVDELDLFLETAFLRVINIGDLQSCLIFENKDHFKHWRQHDYEPRQASR